MRFKKKNLCTRLRPNPPLSILKGKGRGRKGKPHCKVFSESLGIYKKTPGINLQTIRHLARHGGGKTISGLNYNSNCHFEICLLQTCNLRTVGFGVSLYQHLEKSKCGPSHIHPYIGMCCSDSCKCWEECE